MKYRLLHHKKRCENPGLMMRVSLASCCFVFLACWGVVSGPQTSAANAAPVVVRADSRETPVVSEATLLAHRIMARENSELLLVAERRRELANEIEGVLKRLRYAHPETAKVSARASHLPGVLLLGLKPDLFGAVAVLLEGKSGPVALRTGNVAFDALNASLGLRAVRPYPHTGVLVMRLSERANLIAARRAYLKIAGVEYVEPDAFLGGGSDIEMAKSGDVWHIVVRKAWGDCPSGCIYKKMFFFTVKDGEVDRIEPEQAMRNAAFKKLLETRNWR